MNGYFNYRDELYHYGVLGMRWGVRRYQPYGSGGYNPKSKLTMKKGDNIYRYSNKKEKGSLKGAYAFKYMDDAGQYLIDSKNLNLGFKKYKKIFVTKIKAIDDVTILHGKDAVRDIVNRIGSDKVTKAYKVLEDNGCLPYDDEDGGIVNDKTIKATRKVAVNIHEYMKDENNRKALSEYYKSIGYDAIVDPEDHLWGYELPLIIMNENKFKREKQKVIYNKSYDKYLSDKKRVENKGKTYNEIVDKDIKKFKKLGIKEDDRF